MTLSYLSKTGSAVVDATGKATIIFRPDTGQYWLPTIVHVGVRSSNQIWCAVNVGSIAALSDNSTTKDFTFQGSNDTTSIVSGSVVSYGEGIACVFTTGFPNDIAFAELVGLSSDEPPTIGAVPSVPGVRFIGASPGGLQRSLVPSPQSTVLTAGGFINPPPFDMRPYQSFGIAFDCQSVNNATNFNGLLIQLVWSDDSTLQHVVFEQHYEIFGADKNITFGIYGRFELQDAVHGAFLSIFIESLGPDNLNTLLDVLGSARILGGAYVRNRATSISTPPSLLSGAALDLDDTFLDNNVTLAAGGASNIIIPMRPGPVNIYLQSGAAPANFFFNSPQGKLIWFTSILAGVISPINMIIFPTTAIQLVINNTGGVTSTTRVSCTVSRLPGG